MADIKYVVTVDATGAQTAIQTFDQAIEKLGKESINTDKAHQGLFGTITGGVLVANLATKAFSFLGSELGTVITEAIEAEKVGRLLDSTLRAHGESAKIMGDIYDEMSKQIQAVTGVSDEEVKSLVALSYNLGVHREKIDDVVQGAIGLTTLYGGSMQSNLEAVARALQGNWRQADMMIPELRNLTNESEKLALMQQKMAEGFQASTDAMKGASGALTTAKNQWSDFKEGVGTGALTIFGALTDVGNALTGTSTLVKTLNEEHERQQKILIELKRTHKTYADIIADENIKEKEAERVLASVNKYFEDKKNKVKDNIVAERDHTKAAENAKKAIAAEAKALEDLFQGYRVIIPELEGAADATDSVARATDEYTQGLIDLREQGIEAAEQAQRDWTEASSMFAGMINDLYPGLGDIFKGVTDSIGAGSLAMGDFLTIGMSVLTALTDEFQNMYEVITNVIDSVNLLTLVTRNAAMDAALSEVGKLTGQEYFPELPRQRKVIAASGFYSPRLSSDTVIQAHRGERVSITPAAQNNGGGKAVIHNYIYLDGKLMKEFVTDSVMESANIGKLSIPKKAVR